MKLETYRKCLLFKRVNNFLILIQESKICSCRECINKFGDRSGLDVWEAVNRVFDCMPLAGTIDGKVCNFIN